MLEKGNSFINFSREFRAEMNTAFKAFHKLFLAEYFVRAFSNKIDLIFDELVTTVFFARFKVLLAIGSC